MFVGNYNLMHVLDIVKDAETIASTGHVTPDGDCAGSNLAFYNYLKNAGKQVDVYLENIPEKFRGLSGAELIKNKATDKVYDVVFMFDCGEIDRIGFAGKVFKNAKKTVCVDHHVTSKGIADLNFIKPTLSSACELLFEMMDSDLITKETAECLYLGIIHDTGVFHHLSTSKRTMEVAGALMSKGIDFPHMIDESFYLKTYKQNQVLGRCLMESMLLWDGLSIVSYLTLKELEFYQITNNDLGGIIDQLRLTAGVKVAIFIHEITPHRFKVSLRSNEEDLAVSQVCEFFGGGGHKMAAGCTISGGTVHDVINSVTKQLQLLFLEKGYLQ